MNFKKITLLIISFFFFLGFFFNFNLPNTEAQTVTDLYSLIQQIQNQINLLKKQLTEAKTEEGAWCYDFKFNLKIGDSGTEVTQLQNALVKQGFFQKNISGIFDRDTSFALIKFQEKYANEILRPWSLIRGTGFFGNSTRVKLNKFYGCHDELKTVVPTTDLFIKINSQSLKVGTKTEGGSLHEINLKIGGTEIGEVFLYQRKLGHGFSGEWELLFRSGIKKDIYLYNYKWQAPLVGGQIDTELWAGIRKDNQWVTRDSLIVEVNPKKEEVVSQKEVLPSIKITSPIGGEVYVAGQKIDIKWKTEGFPRDIKVQIQLNKGAVYPHGPFYPAARATSYLTDIGKYTFTIPTDILSGNDYTFMISSDYPTTETGYYFYSNPFSIVDAKEVLVSGHDFYVKTLDSGTGNWSFAKDFCQKLGAGWSLPTMTQLRILYQKKNEIGGFKDNSYWSSDLGIYIHFSNGFESSMNPAMTFSAFRCVKKASSITIISPTNEEELFFGRAYQIKWNQIGLETEQVDILLRAYDRNYLPFAKEYFISGPLTADQGFYYWTPSAHELDDYFGYVVPRHYYKIIIRTIESPIPREEVRVESDGYFKITAPALGLKDIGNQLASISGAVSRLIEQLKSLIER